MTKIVFNFAHADFMSINATSNHSDDMSVFSFLSDEVMELEGDSDCMDIDFFDDDDMSVVSVSSNEITNLQDHHLDSMDVDLNDDDDDMSTVSIWPCEVMTITEDPPDNNHSHVIQPFSAAHDCVMEDVSHSTPAWMVPSYQNQPAPQYQSPRRAMDSQATSLSKATNHSFFATNHSFFHSSCTSGGSRWY
jgi:hypothetical protein